MHNAAIHAQLGRLRRRQQFPSANNGQSFLGPHGALTAAADSQVYFCVRVVYIADDPNGNGGLDSEGRYKAYIESNLFAFKSNPAPEVRVSPNLSDGNLLALSAGASVWCYAYAVTQGSSDSSDDGFMLLMPIAAYNPIQAMVANSVDPGSSGDLCTWDLPGGSFATSDNKTFILPDNGTYLSIVSIGMNNFGAALLAFGLTLGGSVVAEQQVSTPTAGGQASATIPWIVAGQQGVGIAVKNISLMGSPDGYYSQWTISRIGDTGNNTGAVPVPPPA